jgi:hypothetical protein
MLLAIKRVTPRWVSQPVTLFDWLFQMTVELSQAMRVMETLWCSRGAWWGRCLRPSGDQQVETAAMVRHFRVRASLRCRVIVGSLQLRFVRLILG